MKEHIVNVNEIEKPQHYPFSFEIEKGWCLYYFT